MKNGKFELLTACEEMALCLEQAEMLMLLLFEEIDNMVVAADAEEMWKAAVCCRRGTVHQSLAKHVFDDIRTVKDGLNGLVNYEE